MFEGTRKLSVILPAYNEGNKIEQNTKLLKKELDSLNINYEIIIVNDGSVDDTLARAQKCESTNIRVLSYTPNRGKGYAVKYGMFHTTGQYRLFMDVDLSTSLDSIEKFWKLMCQNNYDMIIGNRKMDPLLQKVRQPLYRRVLGTGFTWLSSLMIGRRFTDFTCGFKMFTQNAVEVIFKRQKINNWAFDTELIYIALLHRLKIHEVPVEWAHHPGSKVRVRRDMLTSLYGLIKIRANQIRGLYQ